VDYYLPGSETYEQLRGGFNKRISKKPSAIARCKNTDEVAEAVRHAAGKKWAVTIRSGGHCMEGFSAADGAMMIHLGQLSQTEWIDANTIRVGPACTLSKLYDFLLPRKKIIPGGSCAGVGIGGLTLGGGYGLLARKFGLTCDSLLGVTMVDGRGRIVDSSSDKNLLWACRGGNNGNFGVVTSLTFRVHDAPATMQSFRFRSFQVDRVRALRIMKNWFEQTRNLPPDCFSAFVLNKSTLYILLTSVRKDTAAIEPVITSLARMSDKTTRSAATPLAQALKNYYGIQQPLNFKNASAGLYRDFSSIESYIGGVLDKVIATPGMIFQVNTMGGNIQSAEKELVSAFPHREYAYFSELQTYWEQPSREAGLLQKFQEVQEIFARNGMRAQYRNYPDINFASPASDYYGKNLARLQQIKKQYDPDNIFRYEQSIPTV
jgi:FAD/FMN-containing dehydrogenase